MGSAQARDERQRRSANMTETYKIQYREQGALLSLLVATIAVGQSSIRSDRL